MSVMDSGLKSAGEAVYDAPLTETGDAMTVVSILNDFYAAEIVQTL